MLTNESQWWIRVSAVDILSQFRSSQTTEFLLKFIDDPDLKWSIINSLGKTDDPRVVSILLKNLKDPKRGIRMITLNALESYLTPYLLKELKEIYETDPDQGIRQKTFGLIKKLADQGDPEAVRIVETRYQRGQKFLEGRFQLEVEELEMESSELN